MSMAKILTGISRFRDDYQDKRDLFERVATRGQSPEVLFIGCSDSRVPPEIITSAEPGDLFVLRVLGNIVPPYGTGEMAIGAVVEYALLELPVEHIIVCGHTDCGAIWALDQHPDWIHASHLARWIEHARPAQSKVEASGLTDSEQHLAMVRENVLLQLEHLRSYDLVRQREREGNVVLHGWVYHLETGEVEAYSQRQDVWQAIGTESGS
ncbi:MAG: carbonic anhydrase [Anaerolineae bacterium]|jgi:carbonic anhydrase